MHIKPINLLILISNFLVINVVCLGEKKPEKPAFGFNDIEKLRSELLE